MSGESSNGAEWFTRLEPIRLANDLVRRADDPRLGELVEDWSCDVTSLRPGRAVLIGFPQDEGVHRNFGRPGPADAPNEIRKYLYRLTAGDAMRDICLRENPPLDLGNVRAEGNLEETQLFLGHIVHAVLEAGAVPVVMGGGHETAYGHFLGYTQGARKVGIINFDAHLDVRPCRDGLGHSGSAFRQAMEHPTKPLPGNRYTCIGPQPHCVSQEHARYLTQAGGTIHWCDKIRSNPLDCFHKECHRLANLGCSIYVTVDADVVRSADVPGVSAPNVCGLKGRDVLACAYLAGTISDVSSLDMVEINPRFDRDGQSARWAALLIWQFLIGLAMRSARR